MTDERETVDRLEMDRMADDGCPNYPPHEYGVFDEPELVEATGKWVVDPLPGGALNIRPERRAA